MEDVGGAPSYDMKTQLRLLMEFLKQCKDFAVQFEEIVDITALQLLFGDPLCTSSRTWLGLTMTMLCSSTSQTSSASLQPLWEP